MYLSLHDLALRTGERYQRTYPLELSPVIQGGVSYQVLIPEGVAVAVDRVAGGFLITVAADVRVYGPCARCLNEVVLEVRAEQQEFAPTAKDGWEESEVSPFVEGMVLDVAGLAREAVVLSVPPLVVCSSSCRGLCPQCGQDLNVEQCRCAPPRMDERWEKLKSLQLGEGDGA